MLGRWYVYILECKNKSLYTGITSNFKRRIKEHLQGRGGHYTRAFGVKRLLYIEESCNRSAALKRESEIKAWPRSKKLKLIKGSPTSKKAL